MVEVGPVMVSGHPVGATSMLIVVPEEREGKVVG